MKRLLGVALVLLAAVTPRAEAVSSGPHYLGSLRGANLNSTSDQAIPIPDAAAGNYYIDAIRVTGSSCVANVAVGGIYTTTGKGGTAVVANSQTYAALTGNTTDAQPLAIAVTTRAWSSPILYLSLTTPQGATCTANIYVYGDIFPTAAAEPTLTSPSRFQVTQRSGTTGSVTIAGTLSTLDNVGPWKIEARLAGGAWQTVTTTATGGAFSGAVTFDQGQGTLDVRASQGGAVSNLRSVADVGVGLVVPLLGQSNCDGRGFTNQACVSALKAANYAKDYRFKLLADPVGSGVGGIDPPHQDPFAGGSPWPRVAEALQADLGVPVMFIPAAVGATDINSWLPGADHEDRSTLYGAAVHRTKLAGACGLAIFYQGEWDCGPLGTPPTSGAVYKAKLKTLADVWFADTGCKIMPVLLHDSTGLDNTNEATIRTAVTGAISESSTLLPAADLSGLTSDDAFHLQSNLKLQAAADIFVPAIKAVLQ